MKKVVLLFLIFGIIILPVLAAADSVIFKTSKGKGLKSQDGSIVLNPEYQEISRLSYTPKKNYIIPMHALDEVKSEQLDLYKIKKNNLWGVADINGKITVPCKYDKIEVTETGALKLFTGESEKYANPYKNAAKVTGNTVITIVALPVTIIGAIMMPIEAMSKIGQK